MRINNPKNMNNEELLSKIYVDDNSFIGNGSEDNKLKLANGYNKDYTAFQVFAHDYDIPVGECEELGGYVNSVIPAGMTHNMIVRTGDIDTENSDVIIDWGDGTVDSIANGDYVVYSGSDANNQRNYEVEHTYTATGKYIVKIYGRKYYNLYTRNIPGIPSESNWNLMCRVLDYDLPIASNLTNISSFCAHAIRLLKVAVPSYFNFTNCINHANMFKYCYNLTSVKGLKNVFYNTASVGMMFIGDNVLSELEFTLPPIINLQSASIFENMSAYTGTISALFPSTGLVGGRIVSASNMFKNCTGLTGTVPAELLWNNKNVTWVNTSTAFTGCSDEILAQVPASWGGTASDDIIESTTEQNVDELNDRLAILENADLINRLTDLETAATRLANI